MIASASSSKPQLSFTGFICPLKSYSRISSEYGMRVNPVSGVRKLHAGIDFAAPGGTPIYAAASGYVQVAGWSTGGYGNYVHHLPRQNDGWQRLHHLVWTYEVHCHDGGQICQAGRADRLCGHHRQLYRQPSASGGVERQLQGKLHQFGAAWSPSAERTRREGILYF